MSGWTAAICTYCWFGQNPDREPVRVKDANTETCHECGVRTRAGIYIRKNPEQQIYPTYKEGDR